MSGENGDVGVQGSNIGDVITERKSLRPHIFCKANEKMSNMSYIFLIKSITLS